MSKVSLKGLPAGSVTVGVTQGTQTASRATTWPSQPAATGNAVYYAGPIANANWSGVAATMGEDTVGREGTCITEPPTLVHVEVATRNHATNFYADFEPFSAKRHTQAMGGRTLHYRARNGRLTLLQETTIVGGAWDTWRKSSPDGQAITAGTTWQHFFNDYSRNSTTYWFSVAAIDASGNIGPKSATVAYNAPAFTTTGVPSNAATTTLAHTAVTAALAAPTGLTVVQNGTDNAVANLSWSAVAGAFGYVTFVSFVDPLIHYGPEGTYVTFNSGGPAIKAGDLMVNYVEHRNRTPDLVTSRVLGVQGDVKDLYRRPERLENRLNNLPGVTYSHRLFGAGDPAPDATVGRHYLRVTLAGGVALPADGNNIGAKTGQDYNQVLYPDKTYALRFKIRSSVPATLALSCTVPGFVTQNIAMTTSWQDFRYEFTPSSLLTSGSVQTYSFDIVAPVGGISIDRTSIYFEEVGLTHNGYRPITQEQIVPGQYVRYHSPVNNRTESFSMDSFLSAPGTSLLHDSGGMTLFDFFRNCVTYGHCPWLQIDWHTMEDVADMVAYICAPVSSGHPMALRRAAQGQTAPWIDVLPAHKDPTMPKILFEIGNELWNPLETFMWTPAGVIDEVTSEVYTGGHLAGMIARRMIENMEASPYWSLLAPHIQFALGCRGVPVGISFGENAFRFCYDKIKFWGIAAYTNGWENGSVTLTETGRDYLTVLNYDQGVNKSRRDGHLNSLIALCATYGVAYGTAIRPITYEGGPSFSRPAAGSVIDQNQVTIEIVMKGRLAGAANIIASLSQAEAGFALTNHFVIGGGLNWASYTSRQCGAKHLPAWLTQQILTEQIAPCSVQRMYRVKTETQTLTGPPPSGGGPGIPFTADRTAAWMLRSTVTPSTWMLVVVNTDINRNLLETSDPIYSATPTGSQTITVCTNWKSASGMRFWESRGNFRQHGRYQDEVRFDASNDTYTLADPLSTTITFPEQVGTLPADLTRIPVTLAGGEWIMMKFTGVA